MRPSLSGLFWLVSLLFVGASVFFTVNVFTFKNRLSDPGGAAEFPSGRKVTVASIIDGDEISVNLGEARFIVRILGIWSFDATANDTLTQGQGRSAMNYLENTVLNRDVELQFDKFRQDENRRVLAYVHLNNADVDMRWSQGDYASCMRSILFQGWMRISRRNPPLSGGR